MMATPAWDTTGAGGAAGAPLDRAADKLEEVARQFGETVATWGLAVASAQRQQDYDRQHGAATHPDVQKILDAADRLGQQGVPWGQPAWMPANASPAWMPQATGPAMPAGPPWMAGAGAPASLPVIVQAAAAAAAAPAVLQAAAWASGRSSGGMGTAPTGGLPFGAGVGTNPAIAMRLGQVPAGGAARRQDSFDLLDALATATPMILGLGKAAISAGKSLLDFVMGMGGMANPNSAATLQASIDLALMKIGKGFVPLIEAASQAVQEADPLWRMGGQLIGAATNPNLHRGGMGAAASAFNSARQGSSLQDTTNSIMHALGLGQAASEAGLIASVNAGPALRSMRGLPQANIGSMEDYYDRALLGSLQMQSGTTEGAQLAEQVRNMSETMGSLLIEVRDGVNRLAPSFR
jgi:hypothetical protein